MTKRKPRPSKSGASDEKKLTPAEQFELEYAYVLKDLRRVFLLAGAMFALLIILNLVLG